MVNEDKLKIAMLSAHSCPVGDPGARDIGGMSVYLRELAGELSRQGHTVDVYARVHDPDDEIVSDLGERARLVHLRAGEPASINKLAVYPLLPDFTCALEAYRKENELSYDIVYSHYWLSGWVGDYLRRWWDVPHVIMFHTLGALKNASGSGADDTELRIVTEREIMEDCQRIITATERERADIGEHYGVTPDNIGVVPCGVNLDLFKLGDRAAARSRLGLGAGHIILSVGRIDPVKGIDRLMQAVHMLPPDEDCRLLVIGGDESNRNEIDKLRRFAADLGISDMVTFTGTIKQTELPDYYAAADVCVMSSYYESFGLVALESLACGTPVVAPDVGALRDIIVPDRTGFVVADNSPSLLADGIRRVCKGNGLAAPEAMRDSVRSYSWERIAGGVVREFRSVLDKQQQLIA